MGFVAKVASRTMGVWDGKLREVRQNSVEAA